MPKKRKRGRPPKPALCQQVAKLRQAGRSFAEIGKDLRVSKQSVHALLKRHGVKIVSQARLLCHGCSRLILKGDPRTWDRQKVWCLKCLEEMPDAPFSVRLRAFRLSLGMTQKELAERSRPCHLVNSVSRAIRLKFEMEDPREAGEGPWFKAGLRLILCPHLTGGIANVRLAYMPGPNSWYLLLAAWVGVFPGFYGRQG